MDLREALYTTRAMRRITDQSIPHDVQARILDAAVRAPSAGNTQSWRFLLVDDPDVRKRLGGLYKEAMEKFGRAHYGARTAAAESTPEDPGVGPTCGSCTGKRFRSRCRPESRRFRETLSSGARLACGIAEKRQA